MHRHDKMTETGQKPQEASPSIVEPVALNDVMDLRLSSLFERKQFYPLMYRIATVETEFVRYDYQYYPAIDWGALLAMVAFFAVTFASKMPYHLLVCKAAGSALTLSALLCDIVVVLLCKRAGRNPASVHELIFWFGLFSFCMLMGLARPSIADFCQRENMSIMPTTPDERHQVCVHSIYVYPLAVFGIPAVCGRPRMHFVITCALAYVVGNVVMRPFIGIDTTEVFVLKVVADIVILIAMVVAKAVLESAHRLSFEEFVKAYRSRQHAARQKGATDAYLSQLLPPMLYSRVLSREHYEDSSTSVSVFTAAIPELAAWVYPAATSRAAVCEAVSRISQLMHHFEEQHKLVGVERIRVTGDEFIAMSNLIVPTLSHALRIAVFATKTHRFVVHSGVPAMCAIHTGAVRGSVVGSRFLRYDVGGDGINGARQLLPLCPPGEVVVSEAMQELLRGRAMLVPYCTVAPLPLGVTAYLLRGIGSTRLKVPSDTDNAIPHTPEGVEVEIVADRGAEADEPWISSQHSRSSPLSSGSSRTSSHRVRFDDSPHEGCAASNDVKPHAEKKVGQVERDGAADDVTVEAGAPVSEEALRIAAEYAKLDIVFEWSGRLHFFDSDYEAEYRPAIARSQAVVGCATLVAVVVALFVLLVVEYRETRSGALAAQIIFIVVLAIGVGLVIALWNHATEGITTTWKRISILTVGGTMFVLTSLALALSRPSIVGNDTLYMFSTISIVFSLVASGAPWRRASLYAYVFLGVHEVLFISLGGIVKTYGIVFIGACCFLLLLLLRCQELIARQRYRDMRLIELANDVEQREKERLQSALAAVVPPPLVAIMSCD